MRDDFFFWLIRRFFDPPKKFLFRVYLRFGMEKLAVILAARARRMEALWLIFVVNV